MGYRTAARAIEPLACCGASPLSATTGTHAFKLLV